jgi:hypothetical protein
MPPVTAAIFGLIGVVVGVVVTGAVDLYMEHRREQAAIFKAKRLVGEELQTIAMHLELLTENGVTPPIERGERRVQFLPTSTWEANKETVATKGVLGDDDWVATAALFHTVAGLRMVILDEPPGTQLNSTIRERISEQRALVGSIYQTFSGRRLSWEEEPG